MVGFYQAKAGAANRYPCQHDESYRIRFPWQQKADTFQLPSVRYPPRYKVAMQVPSFIPFRNPSTTYRRSLPENPDLELLDCILTFTSMSQDIVG